MTKKNTKHLGLQRFTFLLVLSAVLVTVAAAILPHTAFAAECDGAKTSIISCDSTSDNTSGNGLVALVLMVLRILATGVGIVAIGGLVYAGIIYASAGDSSERVSKAKNQITNVVLGLVAFAFMYAFLEFLIPGGFLNFSLDKTPKRADPTSSILNTDSSGSSSSSGPAPTGRINASGTFAFQNIGREEKSATEVFRVMKSALGGRNNLTYSFAEIDEGDRGEHEALKDVFGDNGWTGFSTLIPILSRLNSDTWGPPSGKVIYVHPGGQVFADHGCATPKRRITVAMFTNKKNPNTKLAVVNVHFLHGAYDKPLSENSKWCRVYWDKTWTALKQEVKRLSDSYYDVVVTGDFNRGDLPKLHPSVSELMVKLPDHILAVPSKNRTLDLLSKGVVDTPSGEPQHKTIWVSVKFSGS